MGWRVGSRSRKRVGESSAGVGVSALPGDPSEYSSVNTNSNQKKQDLPLPIITTEELDEDFTSCQSFTMLKLNSDRYCGPVLRQRLFYEPLLTLSLLDIYGVDTILKEDINSSYVSTGYR